VIQQIVLNSTLVAALLVAAYEYREGNFTVGQFVAVNVYVNQLFAPLNFLGTIYGAVVGSYVDLENLCNMLAEIPDIEDRPNATELTLPCPSPSSSPGGRGALGIQFENVVFAYPSRKNLPVLKGISFTVPPGTTAV